MYRNSPKAIIRVEMQPNNYLKFDLLYFNNYYNKHSNYKKSFFSDDMFMIQRSSFFSVFKSKTIYFPGNFKECREKTITLNFYSEKIRYDFLKKLNRALLEWSGSSFWSGFNDPLKTKIIYNNNIWVLF